MDICRSKSQKTSQESRFTGFITNELFQIGFTIKFEDSGLVLVSNRYTKQQFYCVFDPHAKREYIEDNSPQQNDYFEPDNAQDSHQVNNAAFSAITG